MLYEMIFPVGLMATRPDRRRAGSGVRMESPVPGRRHSRPHRRRCCSLRLPESPRWLIGRGTVRRSRGASSMQAEASARRKYPDDARRCQSRVKRPLRTPVRGRARCRRQARWSELLSPLYRARTLIAWTLWATRLLRRQRPEQLDADALPHASTRLDLKDALRAASLTNVAQVAILLACAFCIDKIGRRRLGGRLVPDRRRAAGRARRSSVTAGPGDGSLRYASLRPDRRRRSPCALSLHARGLSDADAGDRDGLWSTSWLRLASAVGPAAGRRCW